MNDCCERENTNLLTVISLIRQAAGDQGQTMLSDLPEVIATKLNLLAGKVEYLQEENNRLRAEARRYYHADGTFDYLDTAEEVKERRIDAARSIQTMSGKIQTLRNIVLRLAPHHNCRPDINHGETCNCWKREFMEVADAG